MNGLVLVELLACAGATILLVAEAMRYLVERQARRRNAPRFERRIAAAIEDLTEDEPTQDLTPYVCPGCGRNAGHDKGCRGIGKRASQIKIPREGQAQ